MKKIEKCPYCEKKPEWIPNEQVYGTRYGKSYMCYYCRDCDAYVGCHNNTTSPLGTMANAELREWRKIAHRAIDPFWKSGQMKRSTVYKKLADMLCVKEVHVGESDVKMCEKIILASEHF